MNLSVKVKGTREPSPCHLEDGNGKDITYNYTSVGYINPFRYRGYYFDNETYFYYLQSRYYDPAIGRFINADGLVSTGQGILGHNMFAYCGNNPVINADYSGNRHCAATSISGESRNDRRRSCNHQWRVVQENVFRATYAEELAVLEGRSTTYKGVTVFRSENEFGSFSFGAIFLNNYESADLQGIQTLRHEYGHTIQLNRLGVVNYTTLVVIPSLSGAILDNLGRLEVHYYSLPWEFQADIFGKVPNRNGYESEILEWYSVYYSLVTMLTDF